jgi:hypothetical protein
MKVVRQRATTWILAGFVGAAGSTLGSDAWAQWAPVGSAYQAPPGFTPPGGHAQRMSGGTSPGVSMFPGAIGSVDTAHYVTGPGGSLDSTTPAAWGGGAPQACPGNYAAVGLEGATGTFEDEHAAALFTGGPNGSCSPRRLTFGYYGPIWRRWPATSLAEQARQEPAPLFGAPQTPILPESEHESEIYVPPRAEEPAEVEKAPQPLNPPGRDGDGGPPAPPIDLDRPRTSPGVNQGASAPWGELSTSLAGEPSAQRLEAAGSAGRSSKRPLNLRRASVSSGSPVAAIIRAASYSDPQQEQETHPHQAGGVASPAGRDRGSNRSPGAGPTEQPRPFEGQAVRRNPLR